MDDVGVVNPQPERRDCYRCSGTRRMSFNGRSVPCSACVTPCEKCLAGPGSSFCAWVPCPCECHDAKTVLPSAAEVLAKLRPIAVRLKSDDVLDMKALAAALDQVLAVTNECAEGRLHCSGPVTHGGLGEPTHYCDCPKGRALKKQQEAA